MTDAEIEKVLSFVCEQLTNEAGQKPFTTSKAFESRVRELLQEPMGLFGIPVDSDPHPYIFPDIVLGRHGVEVKFTTNDTWRSVANSVFESTRSQEVERIYVLFGKMGGEPGVKWGVYEDCVIHVRTSHVPRFEVEINPKRSLFKQFNVTYAQFAKLEIPERMKLIRKYARGRLKKGEKLWWLEENPDQPHSIPMQARLYMSLTKEEKLKLRAEATLLCPEIARPNGAKKKYDNVALYLLTYHGVLTSQTRDLFTAGSVAAKGGRRGGHYMTHGLMDLENEMIAAAKRMDDALFVEYWGVSVPPEKRIEEWLKRADKEATDWKPSKVLFKKP